MNRRRLTLLLVTVMSLMLVAVPGVAADGTEELGPPSIPIASGSGIVAAGTGLISQPGTIMIEVPAAATVKQVLLYWDLQWQPSLPPASDTIEISADGVTFHTVLGTRIADGGSGAILFNNVRARTLRADITDLGLVLPGDNTLTVQGLSPVYANNGAGVLVIFDDGTEAEIDLRDGRDFAYFDFAPPLDTTVEQVFTFTPRAEDRLGDLAMFFSSVAGEISGFGADRPSSIEVKVLVGASVTTYVLSNELASLDGDEWDTVSAQVVIPAGADTLTIQAHSRDDYDTGERPASFSWIAAALAVPDLPPPPGGGSGCTPGFWRQPHHFQYWVGYSPSDSYDAVFGVTSSFGGTLLEAVKRGGGGEKALGRHAVAALLNAAHADVSYAYTTADVIALVQSAYTTGDFNGVKNSFESENELGCTAKSEGAGASSASEPEPETAGDDGGTKGGPPAWAGLKGKGKK